MLSKEKAEDYYINGLEYKNVNTVEEIKEKLKFSFQLVNIDMGEFGQKAFAVDTSLISLLEENNIDLKNTLTEAMQTAILVRDQDSLKKMQKGFIYIALLDKSEALFENHKKDNFIGINKILFEILVKKLSEKQTKALLSTGIAHELQHEAEDVILPNNENTLSKEDAKIIAAKLSIDEMENLLEILENFFDEGNFIEELKKQIYQKESEVEDQRVLVLGGPDGVLLPYDRFRNTTLNDSPLKEKFLEMLKNGRRIVLITNMRYFDVRHDKDKRHHELGIKTRIVECVPIEYKSYLQNLTIYASAGTYKIEFNNDGYEIYKGNFNDGKHFSSDKTVKQITDTAKQVLDKYWDEFEADSKVSKELRNKYPTFIFTKPKIIIGKDPQENVYSINVIYLPSREIPGHLLAVGELDKRAEIQQEISNELSKALSYFKDEYTIFASGATSLDIRLRNTGKEVALKNYVNEKGLKPEDIIFLGNRDMYSADKEPFEKLDNIKKLVNDSEQGDENFTHVGKGLGVTYSIIESMLEKEDIDQFVEKNNKVYDSAFDYLKKKKEESSFKNLKEDEKVELLYDIYHNFSLTHVNDACWTKLYIEAFDVKGNTLAALKKVIEEYPKHQSIRNYFNQADKIYVESKSRGFRKFYSAIDPRIARSLSFYYKIYKSKIALQQEIKKIAADTNHSVSRVLAGFFQDGYFLRDKKIDLKNREERVLPNPEIVYLGGGGPATTTLLQKFIDKGMDKIGCIISSSDDGGSSWTIMQSLFHKLGGYFIPPGDAAGLAIFLSNDNFKILTLFLTESKVNKMPKSISVKGRITADNLLPVWKERIIQVLKAVDKEQLEDIQQELGIKKIEKSKDYLLFLSSMLNLAELIDRELIDTDIISLERASSANMFLIGAAYDAGMINKDGIRPTNPDLENVRRFLGMDNAQFLPVSLDYERSSLVARYENPKGGKRELCENTN